MSIQLDKDINTGDNSIIDTTDCLEAANAFRAMKNFLFIIVFICLLILQGIFWLDWSGCIDKSDCPCHLSAAICPKACPQLSAAKPCSIAADEQQTALTAQQVSTDTIETQAQLATKDVTKETTEKTPTAVTDETEPAKITTPKKDSSLKTKLAKFIPKCRQMQWVIKSCNCVLIFASALYCLCLLITIKISIAGHLGGINHISRAFFLSLFVLVFILPWQKFFPGFVAGVIYSPAELLCPKSISPDMPWMDAFIYYLRFVVFWAFVTLLLIFAQARSMRWAKATLRRLGVAL